eukprot:TRINITY_DN8635_c0_g1_i2.p1 TRINITY_DN8635_c0_g1~~TRINITY_DN8635_c0_g1_i2.p1  ORF type:complete len:202 (-),score=36.71 TRINITY_DN8635_c0_g1_i2:571-1176(-)
MESHIALSVSSSSIKMVNFSFSNARISRLHSLFIGRIHAALTRFTFHSTSKKVKQKVESRDSQLNLEGTKLSAYDRTKFELNLDIGDPKELHLLGKILYRSQSCAEWGEYELDYVFFAQRHFKETTVNFNPEEIKATAWVSIDNIHKFLEEKRRLNEPTTPWLLGIMNYKFFDWWRDLLVLKDAKKVSEKNFTNYIHNIVA